MHLCRFRHRLRRSILFCMGMRARKMTRVSVDEGLLLEVLGEGKSDALMTEESARPDPPHRAGEGPQQRWLR